MELKIGNKAPAITLHNSDKQMVDVQFQTGITVLLFFPAAFTGVCTSQFCEIRDHFIKDQNQGTQIYGISVDSIFTLDVFKRTNHYKNVFLSDFNKEVSRSYGVLYEQWIFNMRGVSKRSAFVIDKEGIIQYAEILDNPGNEPNYNAIYKIIEKLR